MPEKCARCGSDKLMKDLHLNGESAVYVFRNPLALLFKGWVVGYLRACVCGSCGYTELYTKNFEQLYKAYQQSQGS